VLFWSLANLFLIPGRSTNSSPRSPLRLLLLLLTDRTYCFAVGFTFLCIKAFCSLSPFHFRELVCLGSGSSLALVYFFLFHFNTSFESRAIFLLQGGDSFMWTFTCTSHFNGPARDWPQRLCAAPRHVTFCWPSRARSNIETLPLSAVLQIGWGFGFPPSETAIIG